MVTGGAGLYGHHICAALAECGAHVMVASRSEVHVTELATELGQLGFAATPLPLDLADESSIDAAVRSVTGVHGGVDILVNNAVHRQGGALSDTTADDWRSTSDVNSLGLFLMCRRVGAQMSDQGRGVIVNISSIYGVVAPDFAIYEGTDMTSPISYSYDKGGMISLTRYLASLLGPSGVRVNCLSPGGLATADQPQEFVRAYQRRTPLRRLAAPEDIKGPIAFLASDASSYVTGCNLSVDGGLTAV